MNKYSVLISGGGSNLLALINAAKQKKLSALPTCVIADRDCSGKMHAINNGIAFVMIDYKLPRYLFAKRLIDELNGNDHIVLAGFLSILPAEFVNAFSNKIINIHPSLLPKFGGKGMYGLRVHQAVLDAGERESGCTVHYVDNGIDSGAIIAQSRVAVVENDDANSLQQRVLQQEHQLLVATLAKLQKDAAAAT